MSRNEYPTEIPKDFRENLNAVEERARLYTDADFEILVKNMQNSIGNSKDIEDMDERISEIENDLRLIKNKLSSIEDSLEVRGD